MIVKFSKNSIKFPKMYLFINQKAICKLGSKIHRWAGMLFIWAAEILIFWAAILFMEKN
jgi:hypothetical protein